ncbi:MAG: DUF4404 family protein, partial [Kiritimatiellaceae bacterium]|nr:DUF4404 family protein [Kiritimatiellaceae bacterium]
KLKHGLTELQDELKKIDSDDPKLARLANEVEEALTQTGEATLALAHSLQHTAEEFEANHPQLTAIINNVMTSLSNIGI